ncbi:MAG: hypothetical protein J7604_22410 [Sporocytophaga sp.]|uniref:hypothetical protein n=1 Tax=Sporocytophaga sp. TaxID=2231183 RepID=UPI001B27F528|nr:hypothetical protein [Sporocytophaga sp.]MBO9702985.1 hypothetical protein [Sporocytophaga sp.]
MQLGLQKVLIKEKLTLITDYITGQNEISVINSGLQVNLNNNWKIALAVEFPAPHSDNHHGLIIQVSRQ